MYFTAYMELNKLSPIKSKIKYASLSERDSFHQLLKFFSIVLGAGHLFSLNKMRKLNLYIFFQYSGSFRKKFVSEAVLSICFFQSVAHP